MEPSGCGRVVQFGSCGQLRAPGGELPRRVQSASGQHLAGGARPLEAMASAPLPVAHPLPRGLMPFWVPKRAGNASSPLLKSTLECAPWEPSLRPGPQATRMKGRKAVSSRRDPRLGAWMLRSCQAPSEWTRQLRAEPSSRVGPRQPSLFFWEGGGLGNQISCAEN